MQSLPCFSFACYLCLPLVALFGIWLAGGKWFYLRGGGWD